MKSYGVTIQMKPLGQYVYLLLFIFQYFARRIRKICGSLTSEVIEFPDDGFR